MGFVIESMVIILTGMILVTMCIEPRFLGQNAKSLGEVKNVAYRFHNSAIPKIRKSIYVQVS